MEKIEEGILQDEIYLAAYDFTNTTYGQQKTNISPTSLTDLASIQSILKNPQDWTNFKKLLQICDYYINYDSMCSGAIKNILIPFSQTTKYSLIGGTDKSRKFFEQWLEVNNFEDVLGGLANDYYKYGQTFAYLYHNTGIIQVLPAFRCVVESISIGGEPVVSFEVEKTRKNSKTNIDALQRKYGGYPKEILEAVKKGNNYAQLDVTAVYSVCGAKAAWENYSLPIVTSALPWLIQKEVLNSTQMNELANMMRSFLEVRVGDKDVRAKPNKNEFVQVAKSYQSAVNGKDTNIACVAWNVESDWKIASSKDTLKSITDSMSFINWNILAALSMSPILAAGDVAPNKSSSTSFGTTQAAVSFVNKRINTFLTDVAKMINKMMRVIGEINGYKPDKTPKLIFDLVDLNDDGSIAAEIMNLYDKGLISRMTLFSHSKYDYEQERSLKEKEFEQNDQAIFMPPLTAYNMSSEAQSGAPIKDRLSRSTDPTDVEEQNMNPRPSAS